ncbi:MIZ/SP-RING zinc finger domain-containing protein [Sarocladium implicatum]|nr:MIZ/SP-RING zinc finger domain-containing protein [Sarocladium implicatum]
MSPSSQGQRQADRLPSLQVSHANSTANAFAGPPRYSWMTNGSRASQSEASLPATASDHHTPLPGTQRLRDGTADTTAYAPPDRTPNFSTNGPLPSPAPTTELRKTTPSGDASPVVVNGTRAASLASVGSDVVRSSALASSRSPYQGDTDHGSHAPPSRTVLRNEFPSAPPPATHSVSTAGRAITTPTPPNLGQPGALLNPDGSLTGSHTIASSTVSRIGSKRPAVSEGGQADPKRMNSGPRPSEPGAEHSSLPLVDAIDKQTFIWNQLGTGFGKVERERIQLLRYACANDDWFFIIIHRLYVHWYLDRESVFASLQAFGCDYRVFPQMETSFQTLVPLFRADTELRPVCRTWFATFPIDTRSISELWSKAPQSCFNEVFSFAASFWTEWPAALGHVSSRGFPLLVYEMQRMHCTSVTLQRILLAYQIQGIAANSAKVFQELTDDQAYESWATANNIASELRTEVREQRARRLVLLLQRERSTLQRLAPGVVVAGAPICHDHTTVAQSSGQRGAANQPPLMGAEHQPYGPAQAQVDGRPQEFRFPPSSSSAAQQTMGLRPLQHVPSLQTAPGSRQSASPGVLSPSIDQSRQGSMEEQYHPLPSSHQVQGFRASQSPAYYNYNPAARAQNANDGSQPAQANAPYFSPGAQHAVTHRPYFNNSPHGPVASRNAASQVPPQAQPPLGSLRPSPPARSSSAGRASHQNASHGVSSNPAPQLSITSFAQLQTRIIPVTEYPHNTWDSTSFEPGMHLVRQRSPIRQHWDSTDKSFYQFVSEYAGVRTLMPKVGLEDINFDVSDACFEDFVTPLRLDSQVVHQFREGSLRFRLRICKFLEDVADFASTAAAVAATHWPEHIYISMNGIHLQPRRKQHFRNDLPIELTQLINKGTNTVVISFPPPLKAQKVLQRYLLTIEVIKTSSAEVIKGLVRDRAHFLMEDTKSVLRQRLMGSNDDDIVVEDKHLSISLADPFSSTMFVTPVRSIHCKHVQCFDLDNWLATRQPKPSRRLGEPSKVDEWRCPICGGDARPQNLKIDDFFVDVRANLIAEGAAGTKMIMVDEEGRWTAVVEKDDSDDESEAGGEYTTAKVGKSKPSAVIVLDDDE